MNVVVIGCGPAGLAAAHAAVGLDADVRIIGPKNKTPQRGPIMLHRPIPGINTEQPDGYVRQLVIGGSILDYRLRTYGDVNISISGDILDPGFHTWSVREAYDIMWNLYSWRIEDRMVVPEEIKQLCARNDLVVSTAPAPSLCFNPARIGHFQAGHRFESVPIALHFQYSYPNQPPNTVIYNARPDIPWVRSSRIFNDEVTEYLPDQVPNGKCDLVIHKPLNTDCNCHPMLLRTGRFGKWHNETWIDHAYYETRTALVSMQHQQEWDDVK
jgi:hypothetical protein